MEHSFAMITLNLSGTTSPIMVPLKSISPLRSVSNISMTRCTNGFCWSSGSVINSSMLNDPELSRSSFLNRLPSLFISSASTEVGHAYKRMKMTAKVKYTNVGTFVILSCRQKCHAVLELIPDLHIHAREENCLADSHIHYLFAMVMMVKIQTSDQ